MNKQEGEIVNPRAKEEIDKKIIAQTFSHLLEGSTLPDCKSDVRGFRLVIPGLDTVREVSNILSSEECKAIINATSSCDEGFSRPKAFSREHRDCHRIHTVDKTMSDVMMRRLRPYLPELIKIDGVRWKLSRFTHHWRYVRYYPGGHFSPHYDGVKMSSTPIPCMSVFTVQIYLNGNESFTGGSTLFYPDYRPNRTESREVPYGHVSKFDPFTENDYRVFSVEAESGKTLIFNHALNTLHEGSPVLTGTKFIMRGDILYTSLPDDVYLLPTTLDERADNSVLSARHWCPFTAERHGTRNHVGQVWYCVCATDMHGAVIDQQNCWHDNESYITEMNSPVANSTDSSKILVLVSGKRAAGKDFISDRLADALTKQGFSVYRTALGNINKQIYAQSAGVDFHRLSTDRAFKELHRIRLIEHHTKRNSQDAEWCVKEVLNKSKDSDILLLSDLRTIDDLVWFKKQGIPVVILRISAPDKVRMRRGWDPCPVKDALRTETDLDSYTDWTACWDNNNDDEDEGSTLLQEWIEFTVIPRILSASVEKAKSR